MVSALFNIAKIAVVVTAPAVSGFMRGASAEYIINPNLKTGGDEERLAAGLTSLCLDLTAAVCMRSLYRSIAGSKKASRFAKPVTAFTGLISLASSIAGHAIGAELENTKDDTPQLSWTTNLGYNPVDPHNLIEALTCYDIAQRVLDGKPLIKVNHPDSFSLTKLAKDYLELDFNEAKPPQPPAPPAPSALPRTSNDDNPTPQPLTPLPGDNDNTSDNVNNNPVQIPLPTNGDDNADPQPSIESAVLALNKGFHGNYWSGEWTKSDLPQGRSKRRQRQGTIRVLSQELVTALKIEPPKNARLTNMPALRAFWIEEKKQHNSQDIQSAIDVMLDITK